MYERATSQPQAVQWTSTVIETRNSTKRDTYARCDQHAVCTTYTTHKTT
jgi:hypothetical protein